MQIQRSTSRQELLLKLSRATQDLKSKGSVEDPVSSQLGWCQDRLVSLEHRLQEYQQPTLAEMKKAAETRAEYGQAASVGLSAGALCTALAAATQFSNSSLAFPLCLVATAGLGIAAAGTAIKAGQNVQTARDLGQWQQAFSRT